MELMYMNENPVITVETAQSTDSGVWSARSTFWFGLGIGIAMLGIQVLVLVVFVAVSLASNPQCDISKVPEIVEKSGLLPIFATLVAELVAIGLVLLVIRLRKGATIPEYLALRSISPKVMLTSLLAAGIFAVLCDGISYLCGRPVVPQSAIHMYRTCTYPLLLWSCLVGAAPVAEEVFFRGFLLQGFKESRLGSVGAVLVTALLFASVHIQYDLFDMGSIVAAGVLLGVVRLKSRSLWTCIGMHSLNNVIATVEVVLYLRSAGR